MKDAAPATPETAPNPWTEAAVVADMLALDPLGLGGARLRGRPGPARDAWLARLKAAMPAGAPLRRIPVHATEERLLGGLDLAATLAAGRPLTQRGLLAEADGGVAVLAMAERAPRALAAHLSAALDAGEVAVERDGASVRAPARLAVVALDEAEADDEPAAPALVERLAFDLDLGAVRPGAAPPADMTAARALRDTVIAPAALVEALCAAALALGVHSPRASFFALRALRAAAALAGRTEASEADAQLAARLVLAPRATQAPAPPEAEDETPPEEPPPPDDQPPEEPPDQPPQQPSPEELNALTDVILSAAKSALPPGLLAGLAAAQAARGAASSAGAAGAMARGATRGRPAGVRPGRPAGGARLDLVETLRAAAPWQPLRRREAEAAGAAPASRVLVRREDFRLRRFKRPTETLTLFVVDASGSAAAQRLAEAKGAVELMLAESYVRRDRVALVTFRGKGAELSLPPTRALARAKRALAGLPGGGGTPLASGLDLAAAEAEAAARRGWTPALILLTDGRANVGRDGLGGRARATEQAHEAARRIAGMKIAAVLIDASPRPNPAAAELARAMGARYLPLPRADAAAVAALGRGG